MNAFSRWLTPAGARSHLCNLRGPNGPFEAGNKSLCGVRVYARVPMDVEMAPCAKCSARLRRVVSFEARRAAAMSYVITRAG